MTKVFIVDHNQVLSEIRNHFECVDDLRKADWLFIWNDVLEIERTVIKYARQYGCKVAAFQHGRYGTSKYYPPFNQKITADVLFVWGENDRKSLIESGQDPDKIVVAGTTIFSHLKGKKEHEGKIVVFSPDHWDREIPENLNAKAELDKLEGVKIITKIIEGQNAKNYTNPIQTNRTDSRHLDICASTLATADAVVSISEGTFELLAQALDIPVIVISDWEPKSFGGEDIYKQGYKRVISKGSRVIHLDKLQEVVYDELRNPTNLKKERQGVVISDGGFGLDTVSIVKQRIEH